MTSKRRFRRQPHDRLASLPEAARIPVVFDEGRAVTYAGRTFMIYRFKPASALAPGEYAVVMGGSHYLDFGID
jgi:hypothetical protein